MRPSPGLVFQKELLLGLDEMQWEQAEEEERRRIVRKAAMLTPGLVLSGGPGGAMDGRWLVHYDDSTNTVLVDCSSTPTGVSGDAWGTSGPQIAIAIDSEGALWRHETQETIVVPNDDTWYTVIAERVTSKYEAGEITLTAGSATVTGSGTAFTRLAGYTTDGFRRGTKFLIAPADSSGGNAGTYEIDSVVSDTEITLTAPVPGTTETVKRWKVVGNWYQTTPTDPGIHLFERVHFSRVARTTTPPAGAFIIADVKRKNTGSPKVLVIDRRDTNVYLPLSPRASTWFAPELSFDSAFPYTAPSLYQEEVYNPGTSGESLSITGKGKEGGLLAVVVDLTTILAVTQEPDGSAWSAGVTVETNGTQPSVVQVPSETGTTHVVVFIQGVSLYCRTSTDDGATWTAATLVLDPTTNHAGDEIRATAALFLRNHTILVVVCYYDSTNGLEILRSIVSSDYGASWDTNSNVGYHVRQLKDLVGPGQYHANRPSLRQRADGLILCAYDVDAAEIGFTVSADSTGTDWGSALPSGKGLVAPTPPDWELSDPSIWCDQAGTVLILANAYQTTASYQHAIFQWAFQLAGPYSAANLGNQKIGRLLTTDINVVPRSCSPEIYDGSGGTVYLGWCNTSSGFGMYQLTRLLPSVTPTRIGTVR